MSIVWFRGDLWPYESMTSIGATFIVANGCSPTSFCEWLRQFSDDKPSIGKAFITEGPSFRHKQLLASLDDPGITERHVAWRRILDAPILARLLNVLEPDFSILRACEQCCRTRYHSVIHQLPWLNRCFIHDTPLLATQGWSTSRGNRAGAVGIRNIGALRDIWFPNGTELHRGRVKGERPAIELPKALRTVIASLKSVDEDLRSGAYQLAVRCASPPKAVATSVLATGRKLSIASRGLLLSSGEEVRHVSLAASASQVHHIMNFSLEQFEDLVEARLGHVYVYNLPTPWMLAMQDTLRILKRGHEPCRRALESLGPTFSEEGPRLHRFASEYTPACDVARRLGRHGVFLCRRAISIQALAEATDCSKRMRSIVRSYRRVGLQPSMFPDFDLLSECGLVKVACIASRKPQMNYFSTADCDWIVPALPTDRDAYDAIVPDGPLAQIADALLLERLWRWVWTLNDHERRSELTDDRSIAATSAAALALLDMAHRFVLLPTVAGLRLSIVASAPMTQPDWFTSDHELEVHRQRVAMQLQATEAIERK